MADRTTAKDEMFMQVSYDRTRKGVRVTKRASLEATRAEMNRDEWDMFQTIQDELRAEFLAE